MPKLNKATGECFALQQRSKLREILIEGDFQSLYMLTEYLNKALNRNTFSTQTTIKAKEVSINFLASDR